MRKPVQNVTSNTLNFYREVFMSIKVLFSAVLCLCFSGVVLANSSPTVTNVTASQRTDGSGIVDIAYNLSAVGSCTVSLQVSNDGGSTWTVPASAGALSGDVGENINPGNRHIVWNSKADLPGVFGSNYRIKIVADDGQSTPVPDGMVAIPGGTFQMGDSFSEGSSAELPVHTVTLSPFYMSRYAITNQQYCDFLNSAYPSQITVTSNVVYQSGSGTSYPYCDTYQSSTSSQIDWNGSTFTVRTKSGRDMSNDPMVRVSWYGAVAYANWRSQQEGRQPCYNLSTWECDFNANGYRLPTEAQWEYAARGGLAGKRFPWGDTINHDYANYRANGSAYSYDTSPYTTWTYHPTWNDGVMPYTSPVGSFSANGYGLYDMAGNVWEWCHDWYSSTYYSSSPSSDPTGPTTGTYRVLRGGGWYNSAHICRVAYRYHDNPNYRVNNYGFRISLDF
jgi:formylglycine-generating enzyme required for sulfatase activity